jgi:hypothetical protein
VREYNEELFRKQREDEEFLRKHGRPRVEHKGEWPKAKE